MTKIFLNWVSWGPSKSLSRFHNLSKFQHLFQQSTSHRYRVHIKKYFHLLSLIQFQRSSKNHKNFIPNRIIRLLLCQIRLVSFSRDPFPFYDPWRDVFFFLTFFPRRVMLFHCQRRFVSGPLQIGPPPLMSKSTNPFFLSTSFQTYDMIILESWWLVARCGSPAG